MRWPPHCLIGSEGHNVHPRLFDSLKKWENKRFGVVDYVTKGSNLWTEHFSAVQAEVPDPTDPDTQINARLIETLEDADLIVNTGPWEDGETVADYEDRLATGIELGLPMICANPDLEVVRGGHKIICAGALAVRYEELGGTVRWFGKPKAEIYEYCFRVLAGFDKSRIAAVGDSFRTDLAGAQNAGVDPILVVAGIHAAELGIPPAA